MLHFKKYFLLVWLVVHFSACRENIFLSRKYFYGKLKKNSEIKRLVSFEYNESKAKPSLRVPITCSAFDINIPRIKQVTEIKNIHNTTKINVFFKNKVHGVVSLKQKQGLAAMRMESKLKKMDQKDVCLKSGLVVVLYWVTLFSLSSNLMAIEITSVLISLQVIGIIILAAVSFILVKYLFKVLYQKQKNLINSMVKG